MSIDVTVPQAGESISEVQVAQWLKSPGDSVTRDETLAVLETDKASLEVPSPVSGRVVEIRIPVGEMAKVGDILCVVEEGETLTSPVAATASPAQQTDSSSDPAFTDTPTPVMPAAERLLAQNNLSASDVEATGPGGRLLKEDVQRHIETPSATPEPPATSPTPGSREEEIVPMSMLRRRVAERLVASQQNAALLTTFNEVDMSAVLATRKKYREAFAEKYEIKLGFSSFFIKAAIDALKLYPGINAEIREDKIVYKNYFDIGVAVGGGRGLVVPVVRNADQLSFSEIELAIADYAKRARANDLRLEELQGGTFTISNGGVYGSLLSTPIVNPPQSGILGLHKIEERPVARNGEVVIKPMMYLALTYDHRIVDGREAVGFLVRLKEAIEDPTRMLIEV